jgi:hypothetical protein
MPFCIACGKEIGADQNFCEYCGAAQGEPALPGSFVEISPPPPPPPVVSPLPLTPPYSPSGKLTPQKPEKLNTLVIVVAVICVILIAGVYGIGLPYLKGMSSSGIAAEPAPSPATPTAVPTTISPVTVIQTPVLKRADQYEETYEEIYTSNRSYMFGEKQVFSHDLTRPPLYIRFNITPGMVVREKIADIGLSSEHNITVIYVNPNAWFEITVYDAVTGTAVDRRGFNRDYSQITRQEFMVRTKGNYRIEMAGNDVSVHVQILTGV